MTLTGSDIGIFAGARSTATFVFGRGYLCE